MIDCGISLVSVNEVEVIPINDLSRTIVNYQVIFHLFINVNGDMMVLSDSVIFEKDIILIVPNNDPETISVMFDARCLRVEQIDNILKTTIGVFVVINSSLKVQLLVPTYGFCPKPKVCMKNYENTCEVDEYEIEGRNYGEIDVDCILTKKVYDACSQKDCAVGEVMIPHTMPPDPPEPICSPPLARTMGFWGRGMGGIRMLIEEGIIDLDEFVIEVVIPIVGPGGRSNFLNSFFNDDLFVPEPDIDGIYARYLELYSLPPMGIMQLAVMLLTTYMNVQSTSVSLLPKDVVCLDENTTFYNESLEDIDINQCTFDVNAGMSTLIIELLNDIELILDNCCPDAQNCQLVANQRSELIRILDNINNSIGIFVIHTN